MPRPKGIVNLPAYHRELAKTVKSLERRLKKAEKQWLKLSVKDKKKAAK